MFKCIKSYFKLSSFMVSYDLGEHHKDWYLLAEGGAHLVFQYCPIDWDRRKEEFVGCVLKIPKAKSRDELPSNDWIQLSQHFVNNLMMEWFTKRYIRSTQLVNLNCVIREHILVSQSKNRDEFRKSANPSLCIAALGYLEPNLNFLSHPTSFMPLTLPWSISIEIKVKCGLPSFSPLSDPIKFGISRYKLMQQYKDYIKGNKESFSMAWGEFARRSDYDPLDLCSQDQHQVNKALHCLFEQPQNNLKVMINGNHVYGWSKLDPSVMKNEINHNLGLMTFDSLDVLLSVVTSILVEEEALKLLLFMQALEILDVEGTDEILIRYDELVESVSQEGQRLYDSIIDTENIGILKQLGCYLISRLWGIHCMDGAISTNNSHMDMINLLCRLIQCPERSQAAEQIRDVIDRMSKEDCCRLLKMAMLSYIAKDASIIVTIEKVDRLEDHLKTLQPKISLQRQTESTPGTVCLSIADSMSNSSSSVLVLRYMITIIDVGMKSLEKFHNRKSKEDMVVSRLKEE